MIIAAIKYYIDGSVNELVECRNFRQCVQQPGETFDNFLVALRELMKTCDFCSEVCTQKTSGTKSLKALPKETQLNTCSSKKTSLLQPQLGTRGCQETTCRHNCPYIRSHPSHPKTTTPQNTAQLSHSSLNLSWLWSQTTPGRSQPMPCLQSGMPILP